MVSLLETHGPVMVRESELLNPLPETLAAIRSDHECFGCGDDNACGLHLRFAETANGMSASFTPLAMHQGFQGVIHGGIVSTLLDEAMAWAVFCAGYWAVTGELRVRFRAPLRVGEATTATGRVTGARRRAITTIGEVIRDHDRAIIATATATYVKVSEDVAAAWRDRYLIGNPRDRG
jgi:uncharacterized protein (TIGR00369 family)